MHVDGPSFSYRIVIVAIVKSQKAMTTSSANDTLKELRNGTAEQTKLTAKAEVSKTVLIHARQSLSKNKRKYTSQHPDDPSTRCPFPMNSFSSVVELLWTRKNIIVIGGAGMSVSCGIPDFRTPGTGLYETIDAPFLGLLSPEDLFDLECFTEDPAPFYRFAKALYFPPSEEGADRRKTRFSPSAAHIFLKTLQDRKQLLRVYTQNVDGLEEAAGVLPSKVVYAHGTMRRVKCMKCGRKLDAEEIRDDILAGSVPMCSSYPSTVAKKNKQKRGGDLKDNAEKDHLLTATRLVHKRGRQRRACSGIMKPCITFFGEKLENRVSKALELDKKRADAVIVIGTSLSVAPMSSVVTFLPPSIPRILINRNSVELPKMKQKKENVSNVLDFRGGKYSFDVRLLGFCDDVVKTIMAEFERNIPYKNKKIEDNGGRVATSGKAITINCAKTYLFPGAAVDDKEQNKNIPDYTETVICDHCENIIKNDDVVMKCINCFDFDLCRKCYSEQAKNHFRGSHKFIQA